MYTVHTPIYNKIIIQKINKENKNNIFYFEYWQNLLDIFEN